MRRIRLLRLAVIKVGVVGAAGRMGAEVCRAVAADSEMELVAAVDPGKSGADLRQTAGTDSDLKVAGSIEALKEANAQVAVDFTTPSSVVGNIKWCLENSIHAVVGTTGISDSDLGDLSDLSGRSSTNVFVAPNFAVGAVLMIRFAELAARWMPDAEIIELHHPGKLDSPSGTSLNTARAIAKGRSRSEIRDSAAGSGPLSESVPGARGAETEGTHVHSVRLPGLVAHQEVIFGGQGQTLSIRHDSIDRSSFMPGVLLAIREVGNRRGLTVGLENLVQIEES